MGNRTCSVKGYGLGFFATPYLCEKYIHQKKKENRLNNTNCDYFMHASDTSDILW